MRQHKKCRKCYCASYIFHIFAFGERSSLQDILEFEEALCLSCGWEPRKFAIVHKDSIVVLTHIAWAAIVTSASKVSYDHQQRRGIVGSRFLIINNNSWVNELTKNHKPATIVNYEYSKRKTRYVPSRLRGFSTSTRRQTYRGAASYSSLLRKTRT